MRVLLEKASAAERGAQTLLADVRELAPEFERGGRRAAETIPAGRPLIDGLVTADALGPCAAE